MESNYKGIEMEKEKSRMKRVLASALLLSVCSMQSPAFAVPTLSASTEIFTGGKNAVEGGFTSITSDTRYSNVSFEKNYLGNTYYDIKAEDFKLADFDAADVANPTASGGGAIYMDAKGVTLDIEDSFFTNNQALGNPNALDVDGAAISLVNGTVNIKNSIYNNTNRINYFYYN